MSPGAAVAGTLVALSILVACGKGNANRVQPITEEQRELVLNAVQGLREALNHSPCERIPDLAGEHRRKDWFELCGHLRETWGSWQSFGADYWYRSGSSAIAVEGIAQFTKGNCVVQVVWDLQSASPRMVAFFLRSKEDQVDLPSLLPRHIDPPPVQNRNALPS